MNGDCVMKGFPYSLDYDDPLLAELYDQSETETADVELIRMLIGDSQPLRILECFSGTGRILIPLAEDGHVVVGIEIAPAMNARALAKIKKLKGNIQRRITLIVQDVLEGCWGEGYNVVILGGNAFYELPSALSQERCIKLALDSLAPGGRLFLDNEDKKEPLTQDTTGESWIGLKGKGTDGTYGELLCRVTSVDVENQVADIERSWYTRSSDGTESRTIYTSHKRPVSAAEVEGWLQKHNFEVVEKLGDRQGNPYTSDSNRAIFWARKKV